MNTRTQSACDAYASVKTSYRAAMAENNFEAAYVFASQLPSLSNAAFDASAAEWPLSRRARKAKRARKAFLSFIRF